VVNSLPLIRKDLTYNQSQKRESARPSSLEVLCGFSGTNHRLGRLTCRSSPDAIVLLVLKNLERFVASFGELFISRANCGRLQTTEPKVRSRP
jgi:hypothetical protein